MKKLSLKDFQEKMSIAHPKENLKAIYYTTRIDDAKVKCINCGTEYIKKGAYFLDKRKISICKKCFPTHSNQLKENFELPKEYSYVEPYQGMHNKILIRHDKCGFIWRVQPSNLEKGSRCPKCSKKMSHGEKRIINWLEENNIQYIFQYPMKIKDYNLVLDFYLPQYDLYIEYNGEQHYSPINFFGGIKRFRQQLKWDKAKQDSLKEKLLIIPYTFYDNIENILKSSTTIPNGSTLQAMAKEAENLLKDKENDIVSTSMETQSSS